MKISYATYKTYSGLVVKDDNYPVVQADFNMVLHMQRAAWLAAELEAPLWGTVQSYDGAGMSGGLFHWIGRHRDGSQGPLFQLLRRLELVQAPQSSEPVGKLMKMLAAEGWYIAQDGRLRSLEAGELVTGNAFRAVVAPRDGKVPKTGADRATAERWAVAFHKAFAFGRSAQARYAVDYLVAGQKPLERQAYRLVMPELETPEPIEWDDLPEVFELAMCVYHSHSVNAPAPAASCLETALASTNGSELMGRKLICNLAKKKYGAWDKRYARTRKAAMESGRWDRALFVGPNAAMPEAV